MVRPLRIQYPDALYHVTNRGNERKDIFKDDVDRKAFLNILSLSTDTYEVILHGFVLMKNHWHLLAQTPLANLGEFMRHFNITYTSHYNRRHKRSGHLYQGRYKSFLVEQNSYLSQVSRYIHLNPVHVLGLKKKSLNKRLQYLRDYKWSSLPGYLNKDRQFDFVEYATVLAEHGGDTPAARRRYSKQLTEDLTTELTIRNEIIGQSILGSKNFVTWARENYLKGRTDRERPAVGKIHRYVSRDEVLSIVEEKIGASDILHSTGTTRQIVMTALYGYAGLNNREIGDLLGVDYSTVSQGRKRLHNKAIKDPQVQAILDNIKSKVSKIKI